MRILHVTPYAPDAWAYGGIPRLTGALARGLARRGHSVTICATDACDDASRLTTTSASGHERNPTPAAVTDDGVELRVFPNLSNRLAYREQLFLPRGFVRFMRERAGSFDVAHLHACRNAPGAIAAHYLHRASVPYVLAPNGTAPRIERRFLGKRVFDALFGHRLLRLATRVIAVSRAEHQQLGGLGVGADALRMLPNSLDLGEFSPPPVAGRFRARFGLPGVPLVMYLGQIAPRKRVDALVRAFRALEHPDAWLVIAGNDMGAETSLRALVRALGLERRTLFAGLLRGRARLEALTDAAAVVYPSQQEVFGLVPLEALLCGAPVVVADDSGCGEIIRETGGGLVAPLGDADALAHAIGRLLSSPDDWRSAAASAATRVRTMYGSDAVSERAEALYGEVVGA